MCQPHWNKFSVSHRAWQWTDYFWEAHYTWWDGQEPRHLRLSLGSYWGSLLRLFLHTLPFNCCLLMLPHQSRHRGKRWPNTGCQSRLLEARKKSSLKFKDVVSIRLLILSRSQPPCLLICSREAAYNELWQSVINHRGSLKRTLPEISYSLQEISHVETVCWKVWG